MEQIFTLSQLNECQTHNWETKITTNKKFIKKISTLHSCRKLLFCICCVLCLLHIVGENMNIEHWTHKIKNRKNDIVVNKKKSTTVSHMWKEAKKTWKWNIICTKFFPLLFNYEREEKRPLTMPWCKSTHMLRVGFCHRINNSTFFSSSCSEKSLCYFFRIIIHCFLIEFSKKIDNNVPNNKVECNKKKHSKICAFNAVLQRRENLKNLMNIEACTSSTSIERKRKKINLKGYDSWKWNKNVVKDCFSRVVEEQWNYKKVLVLWADNGDVWK